LGGGVTSRDPAKTRQDLLLAAYEEIQQHGYQKASLDSILARTGVTKGALYHHFGSKKELGYAVVEELMRQWLYETHIRPIEAGGNPIEAIKDALRQGADSLTPEMIRFGCPLNNLCQEMSQIDEGFRVRLQHIADEWAQALSAALARGQEEGFVRRDVDTPKVANFLVASIEGSLGSAKNAQSMDVLKDHLETLGSYLDTLRSPSPQDASRPQAAA
jgi:AcrR family transcriptional regulator